MYEIPLAMIMGIVVGFVAAFFGIGGGVLFVPILLLIFNLPTVDAIGTSLLAVFITSISSTYAYKRQKKILYKIGLLMEVVTTPGAIIGAYLTTIVPEVYLRWTFSVVLIIVAVNLVRKSRVKETARVQFTYRITTSNKRKLVYALISSFFAGMASGVLGIGGGVLKVPIMILILRLPIHYAIATSCFMITITSLAGVTQHIMYNHVVYQLGITLGFSAMIGAQLGAKTAKKTKPRTLTYLFATLLIVIAIKILLR